MKPEEFANENVLSQPIASLLCINEQSIQYIEVNVFWLYIINQFYIVCEPEPKKWWKLSGIDKSIQVLFEYLFI